jgi:hypothetical protein
MMAMLLNPHRFLPYRYISHCFRTQVLGRLELGPNFHLRYHLYILYAIRHSFDVPKP